MVQDIIDGGTGKGDVADLVQRLKGIVKGDVGGKAAARQRQRQRGSRRDGIRSVLDQYQLSVTRANRWRAVIKRTTST